MYGTMRLNYSSYIGYDLKKFNEIRYALDNAQIPYRYKVRNHSGNLLFPGEGTIRGKLGNVLENQNYIYQYEIWVNKKQGEKANFIINQSR